MTTCRVAVVGAGAAGLAAAQQLRSEGHSVAVFEAGPKAGGVWLYNTATDDNPLGAGPGAKVHSSMYRDLRTNLPREIMGFRAWPFIPEAMGRYSCDPRRFPCHEEVASYLQLYADAFQLHTLIHYNTRVLQAVPLAQPSSGAACSTSGAAADDDVAPVTGPVGPRWRLTLQRMRLDARGRPVPDADVCSDGGSGTHQEEFDAVVVCNGHYAAPNLPGVPGADAFPGLLMHSHNYRTPDAFAGQTVLVVGASLSGDDICREVGDTAASVVLSARSWRDPTAAADPTPFGRRANIRRRGMVTQLRADGGAEFEWGDPAAHIDAVIYCTGYRYEYPFLDLEALGLSTDDQHVAPLYEHLWPVPGTTTPTLTLIGLPWKVVPFPLFEAQAQLAARVLAGRAALPPRRAMAEAAAAFYSERASAGMPARYMHMMGAEQWAYNMRLGTAAGPDVPPLPEWRYEMYVATSALRLKYPDNYRDRWDEADLGALALRELRAEAAAMKVEPAMPVAAAAAAAAR